MSATAATVVLEQILNPGNFAWTKDVLLFLFGLSYTWLCTSFSTIMLGFCATLAQHLRPSARLPRPETVDGCPSRTAC